MNFSDDVYDSIMNEIRDMEVYTAEHPDPTCKIDVLIASRRSMMTYFYFRNAFPRLNDEYDMKYDVHVVYYAMQRYHQIHYYSRNKFTGKIVEEIPCKLENIARNLQSCEEKYLEQKMLIMREGMKNKRKVKHN